MKVLSFVLRCYIVFIATNVSAHVIIGLCLAMVLNRDIYGKKIYRTILLLPWQFHHLFRFSLERYCQLSGLLIKSWYNSLIIFFYKYSFDYRYFGQYLAWFSFYDDGFFRRSSNYTKRFV